MIRLKEMTFSDKVAFTSFEKRYKSECGNEPIPVSLNNKNLSFKEFWKEICALKDERTCPQGFVPAKYYLVMDGARIVGAINLRLKDNEFILTRAGHIGYGIAPWERNKGYATVALKLCLERAWRMGIDKVVLTTDLNNYASQRVIAKNGGEYSGTIDGKKLFWIATDRDVTREVSAMAVVSCNGKLLTTVEDVFGREVLSLPKGHVEFGETVIEAAIRECFEETGVELKSDEVVSNLAPFDVRFVDSNDGKICKTVYPVMFETASERTLQIKERRIKSVQYMKIDDFLRRCTYDNIKTLISEAFA